MYRKVRAFLVGQSVRASCERISSECIVRNQPGVSIQNFFKHLVTLFLCLIISIKGRYLFDIVSLKIACVGILGIAAIVFILFRYGDRLYANAVLILKPIYRIRYRKLLIIIIALSVITKFTAIAVFHINSIDDGSDIHVYVTSAYEFATRGLVSSYAGYLSTYPHMFWFAVFLAPVEGLFGISQLALSMYLSLASTISTVLLFDTMSYQFGKSKAFITFVVFSLLPSQVLLPQYITHEIALLFFISISVWLYFRVYPCVRTRVGKACIVLSAILALFFGKMVNALGLVMCIAFGLIFIYEALKQPTWKSAGLAVVKNVLLIGLLAVGTMSMTSFQRNHSQVAESYRPGNQVLWTLFVGSSVEHSGSWNKEDVEVFENFEAGMMEEEVDAFRKALVKSRYWELCEHPGQMFGLLREKFSTIWSVFVYSILYTNETVPNEIIQIVYNRYLDRPLVLIEYLLALIAAIIGLYEITKRGRTGEKDCFVFIELFLMGATALLMITECRNKYTISMQPFFWMACLSLCGRRWREKEKS